jgi:hypothetical protein
MPVAVCFAHFHSTQRRLREPGNMELRRATCAFGGGTVATSEVSFCFSGKVDHCARHCNYNLPTLLLGSLQAECTREVTRSVTVSVFTVRTAFTVNVRTIDVDQTCSVTPKSIHEPCEVWEEPRLQQSLISSVSTVHRSYRFQRSDRR